jgi:hypothetical protein
MWWQGWQKPDQIRERVRSLTWDQIREPRARMTCPCCKGKRHINRITHDDANSRTVLAHVRCLQCDGTGEIEEL